MEVRSLSCLFVCFACVLYQELEAIARAHLQSMEVGS